MHPKIEGSHCALTFVKHVSKNKAVVVFNELSSIHLYINHLVIEFADKVICGLTEQYKLEMWEKPHVDAVHFLAVL